MFYKESQTGALDFNKKRFQWSDLFKEQFDNGVIFRYQSWPTLRRVLDFLFKVFVRQRISARSFRLQRLLPQLVKNVLKNPFLQETKKAPMKRPFQGAIWTNQLICLCLLGIMVQFSDINLRKVWQDKSSICLTKKSLQGDFWWEDTDSLRLTHLQRMFFMIAFCNIDDATFSTNQAANLSEPSYHLHPMMRIL